MTKKISELASTARLEVFNGSLAGKVFQLKKGELVIGRKDENAPPSVFAAPNISLPDSRVSRRHARIFFKNGHYFLEDLGSTNGTFLNAYNVARREPVMMRKGNNVQVGETHMRFFPATKSETRSGDKKCSLPWQSEIGLNEQVFDFSRPTHFSDDT